jgi:2-polyprenyl-3-methyl-5-hydroxy-6-metoxy-1,4-benzoquinol methylase
MWTEAIPIELHAHRKKVDYFLDSLQDYCEKNFYQAKDVSILEVGCSNGRNVALPLAENGYIVTGVDLHKPSIDAANTLNNLPNARFICKDFNEFESSEVFDVIVLSDILEHVHEPHELIVSSLRLLKKGGIVLVCVPNGYGPVENEIRFLRITRLNYLIEWARPKVKKLLGKPPEHREDYNHENGHVQFFTFNKMKALLNGAGLKIDKQSNGALFGGGITFFLGMAFPFIVKPSHKLADLLPPIFVSTWYFTLSLTNENSEKK